VEVHVNKMGVFDNPPCFMTRQIMWYAQLEVRISANLHQGANGSSFERVGMSLVIFKDHRLVRILSEV
jgi:hypothetical protein